MTEVTDKMVEAAELAYLISSVDRIRSAIEAALAAREPVKAGELVSVLRNACLPIDAVKPCKDAADTIERLVDALRDYACPGLQHPDARLRCRALQDGQCTREACGDYCGDRARSELERLGV